MWNPDKPAGPMNQPAETRSSITYKTTADEYQTFRRYIMDSTHTRKAYGVGKDAAGNFFIEDPEPAVRIENKYRGYLIQFFDDMKRENRFIKKPITP